MQKVRSTAAVRALATAALLAALVPAAARAQGGALSVGVVRNEALAPGDQLYGASLTFGGAMAIRLSGAVLPERRAGTLGDTIALRGWTGDADLVLNLSHNPWGSDYGVRINPYVYAGVGEMSLRERFTETRDRWSNWSYGGGATIPVLGWLAVNADARYRRAWERDDASLTSREFPRGWEYRFGLAVGGGR